MNIGRENPKSRLHYAWIVLGLITLVIFGVLISAWFGKKMRGFTLLIALIAFFLKDTPEELRLTRIGEEKNRAAEKNSSRIPVMWSKVYRSGSVWYLRMIYLAFGFSYIIYITFFIRFLVNEIGYSNLEASRLFLLLGVFSLGCGLIWGYLSDRMGRKKALTFIFCLQAVSPVLAGMIGDATGSFQHAFLLAAVVAVLGATGSIFIRKKDFQDKSLGEQVVDS